MPLSRAIWDIFCSSFYFRHYLHSCYALVQIIDENKMTRKIYLILHSEAYVNIYLSYDERYFYCLRNAISAVFLRECNNDFTKCNMRPGRMQYWNIENFMPNRLIRKSSPDKYTHFLLQKTTLLLNAFITLALLF